MNTITVRCTSEKAWREKGDGGENEEYNEVKCAEIILNKFPPENLRFEYEVTGLEEDSNYEMELLFDPSKYAEKILRRVEKELFHVRTPRVQEPKQLDIKKISHVKNPQKGSDWMKSTVNFGKIRFRNKKPAGASEVTLTSGVMYHVKLRIWKEGSEEKIFEIDYQYFVACSHEYKSQKKKTNEDSDANTDTFEPTETASRQGPPHEKMPSTSDNSVMSLLDLPELQALGAFPSTGNSFQLQQMNLMPALQTFVANTNFQTLRGRIPEPLSQQGAGPFLNTQHVITEQNQPETMPSRSDNFEFSLSPLFELQIASGVLPHIQYWP
ncbi:hypothetical protein L5515_010606 [Caenorhabditis briggsae]|uniref:T-box domain-containing protein n=1 Tax=Caenorhabditis briggsae TaxID=6238 RepID=A0AAE9JDE7_CAEBR|nr:hypothetical protein L5515_010606 [Caenorhabditis briggsae]